MGNEASPQRVALEFGWDKLPPAPQVLCRGGRSGQRRAERGSQRPGGAAARRERGAGRRDGERAKRAARGMERLPPTFLGRGASSEISPERENTMGEGVRVWMCVDAVQPELPIIPHPPALRLSPPRQGSRGRSAPLSEGLRGAPGVSGGSGARRAPRERRGGGAGG